MHPGQLEQYLLSSFGEGDIYHPAICLILHPHNQTALHRPLHQTDHRMMPLLKKFGQLRNGCAAAAGKSPYAQHQLVLLRSNPALAGCYFAEAEELAQSVAELRQLVSHLADFRRLPRSGIYHRPSVHGAQYIGPARP